MTSAISSSTPELRGTSASSVAVCGALSPEEQLLALIVFSQATQMKDARQTVNLNAEQLEQLHEQVQKALREAVEAKKDAGFWGGLSKLFSGDLATLAAAVAAVAAAVATGGGAVAVLAVVAAAATLAADHAEGLGISPELATAIGIGASIAALCCGNAGGLLEVGSASARIAADVDTYATAAQYTFAAGGAVCDERQSSYDKDAAYAHADARSAGGKRDLVDMDIEDALDRFASALEQQLSTVKVASSIQLQSAGTNYAILSNWGGAA